MKVRLHNKKVDDDDVGTSRVRKQFPILSVIDYCLVI